MTIFIQLLYGEFNGVLFAKQMLLIRFIANQALHICNDRKKQALP